MLLHTITPTSDRRQRLRKMTCWSRGYCLAGDLHSRAGSKESADVWPMFAFHLERVAFRRNGVLLEHPCEVHEVVSHPPRSALRVGMVFAAGVEVRRAGTRISHPVGIRV